MDWRQLTNLPVRAIMRSPLHALLSRSVLLLSYTGRRSGRHYTTPVNYVQEGEALYIFSPRDRVWWRNLRGLRGRDLHGLGEVRDGAEQESPGLLAMLRQNASFRRFQRVTLDANGGPRDPDDLDRLARAGVVIRITDLTREAAARTAG